MPSAAFRHGTLFTFLLLQPFSASLQERGARALFALICSNAALFQAKVCACACLRVPARAYACMSILCRSNVRVRSFLMP